MAVLKPVGEHLWQVRAEASLRTVPPLELMHLAAAANTVVRDKYGLSFGKNVFFFSSFL